MARRAYSVLAVDGGGIRGAIPARVVQELETRLGRPAHELFDLIAGTSTGGIIALGLTTPRGDGGAAFAASDLVDLYVREGRAIFSHTLPWQLRSLFGVLADRYEVAALEEILRRKFGERKLSEALCEVVIPAYDLSGPAPFFFKRSYARDETHTWDVELWRVARATSAAPTYFDPAELPALEDEGPHALVDGGVFANNPAACAYADARRAFGADAEIHVVSIGTGARPAAPGKAGGPVPYAAARDWGLARWARPLIGVVFDGVAKTVDYELERLCPPGPDGTPRFHRLQSPLPTASAAMDDASAGNVKRLVADAEALLRDEAGTVDDIVAALSAVAADRDAAAGAGAGAP